MPKKSLKNKSDFLASEVISLSKDNLRECLELDNLTLKGFWSKSQWEQELDSASSICIAIKNEFKIIALACGAIAAEKLDITFVAVHPMFQRYGHGKEVVAYLLQKAKEQKARDAILEVRSNNIAAITLYKSLGFMQVSIRENYYRDSSDALVFLTAL